MRLPPLAFLFAVLSANAGAAQPDLVAEGRAIYNFRCYFCHGYSGNAKTVAASHLNPPPADFSNATSASLPEEKIVATLETGRPGTAMKSFVSVLSAKEIRAVAQKK